MRKMSAGVYFGQGDGKVQLPNLSYKQDMEMAAVVSCLRGKLHASPAVGHIENEEGDNLLFHRLPINGDFHREAFQAPDSSDNSGEESGRAFPEAVAVAVDILQNIG